MLNSRAYVSFPILGYPTEKIFKAVISKLYYVGNIMSLHIFCEVNWIELFRMSSNYSLIPLGFRSKPEQLDLSQLLRISEFSACPFTPWFLGFLLHPNLSCHFWQRLLEPTEIY